MTLNGASTKTQRTPKKRGPKRSVRASEKAKVRGITASDVEWRWVVKQAKAAGLSTAAYVRSLIQKAKEEGS